jgi:hypothetical protein
LLYGGAPLGDFAPAWSDVDVCVIVRSGIEAPEATRLARIREELHRRFVLGGEGGWRSGQGVEAVYVAEPALATLKPFDLLSLSLCGHVLSGERIEVPVPAREDLVGQLLEDVGALEAAGETPHTAIWHAAMLHWIARSLVYWREGELVSKTAALERVIAEGGPLSEAFRLALRVRMEGSAAAASHEDELRGALLSAAGPAADRLRSLAEEI